MTKLCSFIWVLLALSVVLASCHKHREPESSFKIGETGIDKVLQAMDKGLEGSMNCADELEQKNPRYKQLIFC